jgi:hypothetical protein
MLPVRIRTSLKSVLRHEFLISVIYHPDVNKNVGNRGYSSKTKGVREGGEAAWETMNWGKSPVILLYRTYWQPYQQRKCTYWSINQMMAEATQFLKSRTTAHIQGKMHAQIP